MPRGVTYGETCAWPGCTKAISWKQAWCYRHWKMVPAEERQERMDAVRAARKAATDDDTGRAASDR